MNKKIDPPLSIVILIFLFIIVLVGLGIASYKFLSISFPGFGPRPGPVQIKGVEKFSSEQDFKDYLEEGAVRIEALGIGGEFARITMPTPLMEEAIAKGEAVPERVSETTVQVPGIDEPDIVKTDGKWLYFSSKYYWPGPVWRGVPEQGRLESEIFPPPKTGATKIIKAFPASDLAKEAEIDKTGNLLLSKNILVIFSNNKISGFNVAKPESPKEKWSMELEEQGYLVAARLYQDKIYMITRNRIDRYHPCPIRPLSVQGRPLEIKCVDIYHPIVPVPADVTFNGILFDPVSGKVEKTISFVGSSSQSVVYMSEKAIFVTYYYPGDFIGFFFNFLKEKAQDLVPAQVLEKLEKLQAYDISDAAKLTELQVILQNWQNSLTSDERLRIENELTNRMSDYYKSHGRDLGKSGLVKINLADFSIMATGEVPGIPLNQFSLDEYQGHLRIATNIRGFWGWGIVRARGETANDVYVLDQNLEIVGSILDLGLGERIYSVRFIEDKAYVVTFRQIDPFYVLDLSKPSKPELKGELKIPGYSSYLHPITKDKILGVGKEGSQVKISLFDVARPEKPWELAKYILDEYWSEILNTHHAFLLDKKHKIFFLPGSKGGYVFSYAGNSLKLERAVSGIRAKRAIYIDDFLYIIGEDKITVLNEINWEKVNEIEL